MCPGRPGEKLACGGRHDEPAAGSPTQARELVPSCVAADNSNVDVSSRRSGAGRGGCQRGPTSRGATSLPSTVPSSVGLHRVAAPGVGARSVPTSACRVAAMFERAARKTRSVAARMNPRPGRRRRMGTPPQVPQRRSTTDPTQPADTTTIDATTDTYTPPATADIEGLHPPGLTRVPAVVGTKNRQSVVRRRRRTI